MINTHLKKLIKSEKGQAMVEFALVLPILLLILLGTIDVGWLFYNQLSVDNAAREAAREVCVAYSTSTDLKTDVYEATQTTVKGVIEKNLNRSQSDADAQTGRNCKASPAIIIYLVDNNGGTVGIINNNGNVVSSYTAEDGNTYSITGELSPSSASSIKVDVKANMKSLTYVLSTITRKDYVDLDAEATFKIERDVASTTDADTP